MTGAIAGNSANGRKKLTARQWAALIRFSEVETRKQIQIIWKQIKKSHDAMELQTIVVTEIKEQQIDINRQSSRVRFGNDVAEDIWKCRFTYKPMSNVACGRRSKCTWGNSMSLLWILQTMALHEQLRIYIPHKFPITT